MIVFNLASDPEASIAPLRLDADYARTALERCGASFIEGIMRWDLKRTEELFP